MGEHELPKHASLPVRRRRSGVFRRKSTDQQVEQFAKYYYELMRWQKKINLTAIKNARDVVLKHFIDSLTIISHIKMGAFMLDVGSGAGFPGIPVKIARPDIKVLLLDGTSKKVAFINEVIRLLGLENAHGVQQRAESKPYQEIMSGRLDVVVSRAVSSVVSLVVVASPYLLSGGKYIAMRGPKENNEAESFDDIDLAKLRFKKPSTEKLTLPDGAGERRLVIFVKR